MKKVLLFSLLVLFAATSCKKENAKDNAEKFLKAFYTADMATAKKVATEESQKFLSDVEEMVKANPLSDSVKELQNQIKIDIKDADVKVDGDNANVTYTLTPPAATGAPSMQKHIKMVKTKGKWLASYTMEDYMADIQAEMEQFQQQGNNLDSTANEVQIESDAVQSTQDAPATDAAPATEEAAPGN